MTCDKQVYSLKMKVRGGQFTRVNRPRNAARAAQAAPTFVLQENVQYGTAGDEKLTLHFARPATGTGPFPVVMFIHGGGWAGGRKDDHKPQIIEAANRGFASVSVGYRLAPKHKFPAQVEDVKCAVRWLRAHAAELNIKTEEIGAVGFSAGAHLAMMLGTMDAGDGLEGTGGWADQSSKVQRVVAFFGPTDLLGEYPPVSQEIVKNFIGGTKSELREQYRLASPITYVNTGDASMLLLQGTEDPLVPFEQAYFMVQALTKAKVPGKVNFIVGASHGWGGKTLEETVQAMWEFLE
jgi:acetyl esterase/lipase